MHRALSTHVICNHRLTTVWLNQVESAGIPAIEIFCTPQHLNYRNRSHVEDLGHWFRASALKVHAFHSPMYTDEIWGRSGPDTHINISTKSKADRLRWVNEIKRVIEVAEIIPFRYLIQHLGVSGQEYTEHAIDSAFSSLEELGVFARQRGVEILLENTPNDLSSAERLETFNAATHLNLNYVFDTGHAHMGAGIEHEFEIMKHRIRSLHVHDNDGERDQHLFPSGKGAGTIDWSQTMSLLRTRAHQYPLLLELREVATMEQPLNEIIRSFDYLETLKPVDQIAHA